MNRTKLIQYLCDLDVCDEVLTWVEQTPGKPKDLWAACQRGDWMIWLLRAVDYDERTMRHIACDCAADALPIYEKEYPYDPRPRDAISVARRYADGAATDDELIAASNAARSAAQVAASDAASDAAWAASWAANSTAASDAARYAEWTAARAAASDVAWSAARARHADMVRARVSWADVERAMKCTARKRVQEVTT